MKKLSLVFIASLALAGFANASLTVNAPTVTPSGGNYLWNYGISGDGLEQLAPGNYATCMGGMACGTFFTIYDFQGYVPGSVTTTNAGWTGSVQMTGLTPSNQIVTDNGGVVNLVFSYNGPVAPIPVAVQSGFTAMSTYSGVNPNGTFTYEAQKISNSSAPDQGQGPVNVPMSGVPEPGSMLLIGGGLISLAAMRRKFAR